MPVPNDNSWLSIANSALTIVGTRLISTSADLSKECTLVKSNWDTCRKAVLRDGTWRFAKEMATLQADSTFTAKFGFVARYPLPANFVRLLNFNDLKGNSDGSDLPYNIAGGYVYTNMSYANLTYIADVTDVAMYDPLFCEALSLYLAVKMCNSLTGSPGATEQLERAYRSALQKARFVNSVEDPSPQLDSDVWLQSRVGTPGLTRDPQFPAQTTPTF